jgi:acetylornithine/N-succinyldiaminopimelate aminotransferase
MERTTNEQIIKLDQQYYLPVFKRLPLALVRGEGCYVWDADGNKYLDALAGIAVNSLGHCHPAVVSAITEQVGTLMHISNFYASEPQAAASRKLAELSGLERVFFTNSGGEAAETAIKLARKYAHGTGRGGEIITIEGCFHGRTLATIATGSEKYQQGFGPMPGGFRQVPFDDVEALGAAISEQTAGIMLEPVQGEGGVRPFSQKYLRAVRELCDNHNITLIFDEVQCGIARTGRWFAGQHYGVQPDILALAKGIGAGFPVGATLCNDRIAAAINYGDHGTTFGGNPLACSAVLATLKTIEDEGLVQYAAEQGERLLTALKAAAASRDYVTEVRGKGLMLGVELSFPCGDVVSGMLKRGVLANCARERVIRLVPPLIMKPHELDRVVEVMWEAADEVAANGQ